MYICVHADPSDRQEPTDGYTHGFGVGDEELLDTNNEDEKSLSEPKNLRRIDHVHVTPAPRDSLFVAYTAFVARADHNATHVTCSPPTFDDTPPMFTCFEEFLSDEECEARVSRAIASIEAASKDWWNIATTIIRTEATAFHREVAPPQDFNIMGLVLTSTKQRVYPQVWVYPKTKGHSPPRETAAYSLLVALYEKERHDKKHTVLLGKPKGILGGENMSSQSERDSQAETDKNRSINSCQKYIVGEGWELCERRVDRSSPSP